MLWDVVVVINKYFGLGDFSFSKNGVFFDVNMLVIVFIESVFC